LYGLDDIVPRLASLGREPLPSDEGGPRAAVAAILRRTSAGSAELFFIQRAERTGDPWSGHIAFPGGRREPEDTSLLATAMRETMEEVGLDLERAELVARLPDVPAFIRSKGGLLVVAPFVFALREEARVVPNVEVSDTLWVPLEQLARGEGRSTYSFTWEGKAHEVPCFRLPPGERVLWGMTYRMLETMLEALGVTL